MRSAESSQACPRRGRDRWAAALRSPARAAKRRRRPPSTPICGGKNTTSRRRVRGFNACGRQRGCTRTPRGREGGGAGAWRLEGGGHGSGRVARVVKSAESLSARARPPPVAGCRVSRQCSARRASALPSRPRNPPPHEVRRARKRTARAGREAQSSPYKKVHRAAAHLNGTRSLYRPLPAWDFAAGAALGCAARAFFFSTAAALAFSFASFTVACGVGWGCVGRGDDGEAELQRGRAAAMFVFSSPGVAHAPAARPPWVRSGPS